MTELISLECVRGHQFVIDADDVDEAFVRCPIPDCGKRVPLEEEDDD